MLDSELVGHRHIWGKRATTEMGLHHDAEHGIARREAPRAGADGLDGAGVIAAEHGWEAVLHHRFEPPGCDGQVESVQRRVADSHEDFAVTRFWARHVENLHWRVHSFDGDRLHREGPFQK
jgi:hypothetical protein